MAKRFVAAPTDLQPRLEALLAKGEVSVWLGALAHDVLADHRFAAASLAAPCPECPVEHGFALLRLYRLTGDPQFVARARSLRQWPQGASSRGSRPRSFRSNSSSPNRRTCPPSTCRWRSGLDGAAMGLAGRLLTNSRRRTGASECAPSRRFSDRQAFSLRSASNAGSVQFLRVVAFPWRRHFGG
jgi:hypothetical protein